MFLIRDLLSLEQPRRLGVPSFMRSVDEQS